MLQSWLYKHYYNLVYVYTIYTEYISVFIERLTFR